MDNDDSDPDRDRIEEICRLALQAPPAMRSSFVAKACDYDPDLISEVNSRLAAHEARNSAPPIIDAKPEVVTPGSKDKGGGVVPPKTAQGIRWKAWASTGIAVIVLASLSLGIYKYIKWESPPASHSFRYWLMVQETRGGQDYQQPYQSFGEETFESGDKFQLNVTADEPGYLYIFNQGPPEPQSTSLTLVYPNQKTNSGSSAVGSHQPVQSEWIIFRGPAGAENFWMVWSVSPIAELEAAKARAFEHQAGGLTDQDLVAVREFLRVKESEIKVRIGHYESSKKALVSGRSELLIAHAEFKHR